MYHMIILVKWYISFLLHLVFLSTHLYFVSCVQLQCTPNEASFFSFLSSFLKLSAFKDHVLLACNNTVLIQKSFKMAFSLREKFFMTDSNRSSEIFSTHSYLGYYLLGKKSYQQHLVNHLGMSKKLVQVCS